MIKIKIAHYERLLDEVDEQWINQQINRRRAEGQAVCVRITIQERDLDMILSTPTCGVQVGGGGRPPRSNETIVFELWDKRGFNDLSFNGGNLIAFLKQYKHLFC